MSVKTMVQDVETVEVVEQELETIVEDMDAKDREFFNKLSMIWNHGGH